MGSDQEKASYNGHRDRLRTRFMQGGPDALPDYELLELVLFRAIPRRDIKPLAKELIDKFGSFADVVSAEPDRLREFIDSENVVRELKIVQAAALRLARGKILNRPVISSWSAMIDFSHSEYSRLRLQYTRDYTLPEADNQFFLQYVMSLGAHGAHAF